MTENLIQHQIDQVLDGLEGEVSTASRIVNAFLDLRLAGAEHEEFVALIDVALADLGGRKAVETDWTRATLAEVRATLATGSLAPEKAATR